MGILECVIARTVYGRSLSRRGTFSEGRRATRYFIVWALSTKRKPCQLLICIALYIFLSFFFTHLIFCLLLIIHRNKNIYHKHLSSLCIYQTALSTVIGLIGQNVFTPEVPTFCLDLRYFSLDWVAIDRKLELNFSIP